MQQQQQLPQQQQMPTIQQQQQLQQQLLHPMPQLQPFQQQQQQQQLGQHSSPQSSCNSNSISCGSLTDMRCIKEGRSRSCGGAARGRLRTSPCTLRLPNGSDSASHTMVRQIPPPFCSWMAVAMTLSLPQTWLYSCPLHRLLPVSQRPCPRHHHCPGCCHHPCCRHCPSRHHMLIGPPRRNPATLSTIIVFSN